MLRVENCICGMRLLTSSVRYHPLRACAENYFLFPGAVYLCCPQQCHIESRLSLRLFYNKLNQHNL